MATIRLQPETEAAMAKVPSGSVAAQAQRVGLANNEPLYLMMDGLIRYAKAYRKAYDAAIGDDAVLGESFAAALSGVRGLLDGNGVVAMERDISTDSKDNGAIESMYWAVCEIAGIDGDSI